MLLRLALRNLRRHPWRSLATVLGLALGVAAVLATLSVGDNVQANVRRALQAVAGTADLLVAPGVGGRAVFPVQEALPLVQATPGVASVTPVLVFPAEPVRALTGRQDTVVPGVGTGFQLFGRAAPLSGALEAGTWPQPGAREVALSRDFAEQNGFALGSEVRFATQWGEVPFRIVGYLDGAAGLGSAGGGRVGLSALEDVQAAARLGGRASYLEVTLEPGGALPAVREGLGAALGEAYTVTLPAGAGDFAAGIVGTLQAGLQVLAVTLMALGGFMAYNTFAASVVERTREYALLRTICLTAGQVRRLALLEAALLSAVGVAVGLLLGVGLSALITFVNAALLGYEVRTLVVPLPTVLLAAAVGALTTLAAGYLPARAAASTPPVVAARRADAPATVRPLLGLVLGCAGAGAALLPWPGLAALFGAALSMALLFLGVVFAAPWLLTPTVRLLRPLLGRLLGHAGRLGGDFTLRNAARNGVAIGAVVVGMTLTIGVGGMVAGINRAIADWVGTTVVGDLFVTTPVRFPEDFAARAGATVPALQSVSGVAIRAVRFRPGGEARERTVALVLVEPERFAPGAGFGRFQYAAGQGDDQTGHAALVAGEVLAATTLRERFGLGRGDAAELRTTEGFASFSVGGVIVDFTGGGEAFVAALEQLPRFGGGVPDLFVMTVAPGSDPEAARAALQAAFPELYLEVSLGREYQERILELTGETFVTTNGLLALAILIAALGVANTLGMNLQDRQRDVAMLRTLGLTRGGALRMVMAEGVVLVVLGAALGTLIGLLLSQVITAGAGALTGFVIRPHVPWALLVAALLASPVVGVLASLLPARRAARLPPALALGQAE